MSITYAKFISGAPVMADYTPGSDVNAGDVVVGASTPRIAHLDIPSGTLGALALEGGIYQFPKTAGGSTAIAADTLVYWDNTLKVITITSSGNKRLGYTIAASVDADTTQNVLHSIA